MDRKRHPIRMGLFLVVLAIVFHALKLDAFILAEVIGVAIGLGLKARRRQYEVHQEALGTVDVGALIAERDELARQITAGAAEWQRYKALLAAALLDYPDGLRLTPDMAAAAADLEVYVTPLADGGLEARSGYPVKERSA